MSRARMWSIPGPRSGEVSAHLSIASSREDHVWWERSSWSIFYQGRLCDQSINVGPCRGERTVVGAHVPNGFGEFACHFDASHLLAALFAEPRGGALIVFAVGWMLGRVDRGFNERPAQVLGPSLRQRTAVIFASGLVHPWAQPDVPAQVLRRRETMDVADL